MQYFLSKAIFLELRRRRTTNASCKMIAIPSTLLWILAALLLIGDGGCLNPFLETAASFDGGIGVAPELPGPASPIEGSTPPHVVIERIVSYPGEDDNDLIVLRNIGGQTADMTNWVLADAENVNIYKFGDVEGCEQYIELAPTAKITLGPVTPDDPCGFTLTVGYRDAIALFDAEGNLSARVAWERSEQGTAFRRWSNGDFSVISEAENVVDTLFNVGQFSTFLMALHATGLTDKLMGERDPKYKDIDLSAYIPPPPPPPELQFPSWFGYELNRSAIPPPPPPPPRPPVVVGVPELGPYTLLAPTDEAFTVFRGQIAGPGNPPASLRQMLAMPELLPILMYHIIPGEWTSEYLANNTAIHTSKGVEVVPFTDGAMTEGRIMLHDSCVDKPTPDPFDCETQIEFEKCGDPYMVSPLGAQWQGGYCQRTCQRCTCDPSQGGSCATIEDPDIMSTNGVIHAIDRVLFPPPAFEQKDSDIVADSARDALQSSQLETASKEAEKTPKTPISSETPGRTG
ncbi:hypothetical protein BSKO_00869 [Bryopsis sp. KO-2023]|nr:hypothetical protein BSKO_00869 [Bryopsis sp. KO-2023]